MHLIEQGIKPQEVSLPVPAELFQPLVGISQRPALDPADMLAAYDASPHEPCPLQHFDVLGCGGKGHPQRRGQFAEVLLPVGEGTQDRPAGRMGQGMKDAVEGRRAICNHMV